MEAVRLVAGMEAPHFVLPDPDMENFALTSALGRQNVVLYFYPKDNGRCCVTEATEFSDLDAEFVKMDTLVVGISRDDCLNLAEIRDEHGLTVLLLSDPDARVCKRYGVAHTHIVDGHKKNLVERSTFIINKQGILTHTLYGVHAHGHPREVLDLVKGIS